MKFLFFLIFPLNVFSADMSCVHIGDSQSSKTPFSKRLQENFKNDGIDIFTYARPSSKASHWGDVKSSQKYGPILTKGRFRFSLSTNSNENNLTVLHDNDKKAWAQTAIEHHNKKNNLDCVIFQLGDNVDSLSGTKKLMQLFEKLKNKPGKCYWVTPTWSEPQFGYKHMNDAKKIEIRKTVEKALKDSNCKIISTTGHGDKIDYSFKKKLEKVGRYTGDGLHLNSKGGKLWADEAYKQIISDLNGSEAMKEAINLCTSSMKGINAKLDAPNNCSLQK